MSLAASPARTRSGDGLPTFVAGAALSLPLLADPCVRPASYTLRSSPLGRF